MQIRRFSPDLKTNLWPARLDHKVWTEDEPLEAILIHGPAEREKAPK